MSLPAMLRPVKKTLMRRNRKLHGKLPSGDWIRILVIEPGRHQDRIICRFQLCSIRHGSPEYEALSYIWGKSDERVDISCNDHTIKIRCNLEEALRKLRLADRSRLIWADAICINQENTEERGHQVRLMSLIYRKASRVLIWVGRDENRHAHSAFSTIHQIVKARGNHIDTLDSTNPDLRRHEAITQNVKDHELLRLVNPGWESLQAFYRSTWFRRLWVLQEVVLSSSATIMWGDAEISWELVGLASERIQDDHRLWNAVDQRTGIGNAYLMHSLKNPRHPAYSFRVLLQRCRRFETTEPKDRIFAVLGLPTTDTSPDKGLLFLEPDYRIPVSQLYIKVARRMIELDLDLGLLSAVQHGSSIEEGFPSWVPRWDQFSINILAGIDRRPYYVASGLPEYQVECAPKDPGSLLTQGVELDTIASFTDTISENDFKNVVVNGQINNVWTQRFRKVLSQRIESDLKALCWTLTAGKDWADEPIRNYATHWSDFAAWWARIFDQTIDAGTQAAVQNGNAERFLVAASDSWSRRLFVTSSGFLGLGPEALRDRDLVCILSGGPVPYVLRKVDMHYQFVGESYVYGMMKDEAVQQWREGKLVLKHFEVR